MWVAVARLTRSLIEMQRDFRAPERSRRRERWQPWPIRQVTLGAVDCRVSARQRKAQRRMLASTERAGLPPSHGVATRAGALAVRRCYLTTMGIHMTRFAPVRGWAHDH